MTCFLFGVSILVRSIHPVANCAGRTIHTSRLHKLRRFNNFPLPLYNASAVLAMKRLKLILLISPHIGVRRFITVTSHIWKPSSFNGITVNTLRSLKPATSLRSAIAQQLINSTKRSSLPPVFESSLYVRLFLPQSASAT